MSQRLTVGNRVADFELPDQTGKPVRLSSILGKGPVVVFFYPKDETAGCTQEVCAFRDVHAELAAAGATVLGLSGDGVASHERFATKHRLPYALLADAGDRVRNEIFGVPRALFGIAPGRVTYILDKDGVIRHVHEGLLNGKAHATDALTMVKKLATR